MTTRRQFLGLLGAAAGGATVGAVSRGPLTREESPASIAVRRHSPHGPHQAGVAAPPAQVTEVLAFDLLAPGDDEALGRLLRAWSGDVVAFMEGRAAPGDTAPGLVTGGSDLTITVGLGAGAFASSRLAPRRPDWLRPVPAMRHDALEERWSGGDLVVVVSCADGTTASHVARRMTADAAPFARPRWRQAGFWNPYDASGAPVTGRNLFGQVDGSGNPRPGTDVFDSTVWSTDPAWMSGGTSLVVRRIRMDLDAWDKLTKFEQELSVGRDLDQGAFLSGGGEFDAPDFDATRDGDRVIPLDAHARLAHPTLNAGLRILRKGANYVVAGPESSPADGANAESGLIFLSFQADPVRQFVPLQQRLDASDALNAWTTAIGSAVFAVLPGFDEGGWLGEGLFAQP